MLEVTLFDLHSDWRHKWSREVVLVQNASTELYKGGTAKPEQRQ
jgi:beta-mannosidase